MNTRQQTAKTAQELAALMKRVDIEKGQKVFSILKREGILAGCFSQYCNGVFHAHAPTN